jgi:lysozyme
MNRLIEMLKRHEGVKSYAYQCTAGRWTIGVGRNIDENGGLGLSTEEIDFLLANDIARCESELERSYPWFESLDGPRRDAIINIFFNLGGPSFRKFKKAIAAMKDKDYEKAAVEFLDSKWARQVGNRALELTDIIKAGSYV